MRRCLLLLALLLAGCASVAPTPPVGTPHAAPAWPTVLAAHTTLTGAQWDAYAARLTGRQIGPLPATVVDAYAPIKGLGYTLYLHTADTPDRYNLTIDVSATEAARWAKGQAVTVQGTIQRVSCTVWCSAVLQPATVTAR